MFTMVYNTHTYTHLYTYVWIQSHLMICDCIECVYLHTKFACMTFKQWPFVHTAKTTRNTICLLQYTVRMLYHKYVHSPCNIYIYIMHVFIYTPSPYLPFHLQFDRKMIWISWGVDESHVSESDGRSQGVSFVSHQWQWDHYEWFWYLHPTLFVQSCMSLLNIGCLVYTYIRRSISC